MATGSTQTISTKTPFGELILKTLQERERNIVCLSLEEKVSLMDIMGNEKTKGKRLLMEVDSIQELEKRKLLKRDLDPSPEVVDVKTTAMETSIVSELPFAKDPFLGALEGQANECYTSSVDMLKNKFEQLEKQCKEEMNRMEQELENVKAQHKEEMNRMEQELENVKAQHKEEMNRVDQELENVKAQHKEEMNRVEQELENVKAQHKEEMNRVEQELETDKAQHKEEMNRMEQELENVKAQHKEEMNMLVHKANERSMHQQEEIEKIKKRISSLEGWIGCCFLRGKEVNVFEEHGEVISALLNNDDDQAQMLVSTKDAAIKLSQVFNLEVPVDIRAHAFKSKIFELLKQRLEPLRKFLFKENNEIATTSE